LGDKLRNAAMNPKRMQQVYELYHAARDCEPGERAALLARADPELRSKVELLLAQGSHEGVLDRPALDGAPSLLELSSAQLTPGTQLGPYKIEAPIGAGGMGEVYRARDTKLKRDVAVKVLPAAFASDRERVARFRREAEVLASLNHPGIAAIYGIEDRALIMELVAGRLWPTALPKAPSPPMKPRTSCCRLPQQSNTRTIKASSTATSSPPTSRSIPRIKSKSWTSD